MTTPQLPKPVLKLTDSNGNAFALLAKARQAARAAGWSQERITALIDEAAAGDYDQLLRLLMREFDVR